MANYSPVIGAASLRVRVGGIAISLGAVRVHVDGLGVAIAIDAGLVIATAPIQLGCPSAAYYSLQACSMSATGMARQAAGDDS
ncbi:hypothetical protein MKX08_000480 [Trichoderma sp. CBMAI-0020]|nr:hypothetical protein MKX08_000480 [Trichoderma sp. CBMAI-0020]